MFIRELAGSCRKLPENYAMTKSDIMETLPVLGNLLVDFDSASDLTGLNRLDQILTYNNLSSAKTLELVRGAS